jgi:hypothetical protein
MRTKVDQVLLGSFPGYPIVKSLADNMQQSEDSANSFVPVLLNATIHGRWRSRQTARRMAS